MNKNSRHNKPEEIKVNPPNISDETKKEMAAFFLKHSVPRILAEKRESLRENEKEQ